MTSLPLSLVGDGARGAVRRRGGPAVPVARLRRVDGRRCRRWPTGSPSSCPWYSSVHRGAGYKSQMATAAYEEARAAALRFAGRERPRRRRHHRAQHHRGHQPPGLPAAARPPTTWSSPPWSSTTPTCCRGPGRRRPPLRRVRPDGTLHRRRRDRRARRRRPRRRCWPSPAPPTSPVGCRRSTRSSPPPTSAACPCWSTPPSWPPHRPLPADADFVAWSGHKMYAPFGAGVLIGPRSTFADGDPFLAGGGAVDLVDLDEVMWTDPPEREEAGSPNVIGAVALGAAIDELEPHRLGRDHRPRGRAGPPPAPRPGRHRRRAPARARRST